MEELYILHRMSPKPNMIVNMKLGQSFSLELLHKKELNANYHNVNVVYFECLPIFIQFYFMYAN